VVQATRFAKAAAQIERSESRNHGALVLVSNGRQDAPEMNAG
jgi:hypothetical protein